LLNFVRRYV